MALSRTYHHYDTFREELAKAYPAFGHALWEPNPGEYPPVEVGDVGFIRQGKFHRLFNALYSEDHPSNQRFGVPEGHEQLQPIPNHIDRGTLNPNTFYSYGVSVVSGGLEALATGSIGSAEVSFSCTKKQGAVLTLPVTAQREDTLTQDHFREWIIMHIDSWFAFAQKLRLGIEMRDIILVTGYHRTRSWSNITFNEVQTDAQFSLGVDVAGTLGASVNWRASSLRIQGAVPNHGPSGENLPENQCIFIRGFRIKRTFLGKMPRIRAAAEPKPDPRRSDHDPEEEVVSIPSVTEYQDPLHVLLEYIAKRAPHCDMALVHDDDLERILGPSDRTSLEFSKPDVMRVMMDYFEESKPEIIESTSQSKPANDQSPGTDTEHMPVTVAMLSAELKSLVLVHDDDLEGILSTGGMPLETLQPEGMVDYLQRSQLETEVMSGPLPANNASPGTGTKLRMVARLSEKLKSRPSPSKPTMKSLNIKSRILIIGRANSGKTSILQRVCGTTDSPIVYRGNKKVQPEPSIGRGEHKIEDELTFSNCDGYIFHDSCGIESGSSEEIRIAQEFIRQRSGKVRLQDRLHAIWYCIPMDNQRPQLDLKVYKDLCSNESASVPVIVIFTKYDQFRRNVQIHLEDFGSPDDNLFDVAERQFQEHYLNPLGDDVRFVRLEKMHKSGMRCDALLEQTANALNDVVAPMTLDLALDTQRDIQRDLKPGTKLNKLAWRIRPWIRQVVRRKGANP